MESVAVILGCTPERKKKGKSKDPMDTTEGPESWLLAAPTGSNNRVDGHWSMRFGIFTYIYLACCRPDL